MWPTNQRTHYLTESWITNEILNYLQSTPIVCCYHRWWLSGTIIWDMTSGCFHGRSIVIFVWHCRHKSGGCEKCCEKCCDVIFCRDMTCFWCGGKKGASGLKWFDRRCYRFSGRRWQTYLSGGGGGGGSGNSSSTRAWFKCRYDNDRCLRWKRGIGSDSIISWIYWPRINERKTTYNDEKK